MNSLKLKFFFFFIGLGLVVALMTYIPYSRYIKYNYETTLTQVLRMLEKRYPILADPAALVQANTEGTDECWNLAKDLQSVVDSFGLAFIYYTRPSGNSFQLLAANDYTPAMPLERRLFIYPEAEVPDRMSAAYKSRTLEITPSPFSNSFGTFISAYIPIFDKDTVVGVLGVDYDYAKIQVFQRPSQIALLLSIIASIIAAALLTVNVSATLVVPIRELDRVAGALADMNFKVDIMKLRNDEIGKMQRAMLKIRDNMQKGIADLTQGHIVKMIETGKRLNEVIIESSESLVMINSNMDVMQSKTDMQMQSVSQTSSAVAEIVKSINSLDAAVATQASHITESSAAIEEMVANIASIRSVVGMVSKTTATLSKSSNSGHSMMIKLAEDIKHIQEQSATLQSANKTIADIAGQTNILAMNAAIEAAHAGDTGKGFAVVAGEIRKLAELAGKESEGIAAEIKKMEKGIEQISAVSGETVRSMNTIFTEVKNMDSSFSEVNSAVEEQASGGGQILTALKAIQDMTGQVRDGSKLIHKQSSSIHGEVEKLQHISQEVTNRVQEVQTASRHIASSLEKSKELIVNS
ncbi:methyl-accepting chemotaxis protein [Breznakiellaceae bacterium SP9]